MRTAAPKLTEADLCAGFIAVAKEFGWTAYPEFAGFDFVLVRNGIQIGFQAKLRFNAKLIAQITPEMYWSPDRSGPHYRAVLVNEYDGGCNHLCILLGFAYFYRFGDEYPNAKVVLGDDLNSRLPQWADVPLKLPDYIPDVAAGASGPIQLTTWKIGALKVCAIAEMRGWVGKSDFQFAGIDHRRWVAAKWAVLSDGRYIISAPFPAQHPVVYEQIKAEMKEQAAKIIEEQKPKRRRK